MSSLDKDRRRRVSEPTEADFARGVADSATKNNGLSGFLLGYAVTRLVGKKIRRSK